MSERESLNARAVFSFGPFQADLCAGQLTKHGMRIKMQEKPYQVLALLLERSGEIVTREELRARLWGSDTYVDFDRNLNIAVNKMREALCDSSEKPRYIETVPRKGYRFIAPVSLIPKPQAEPAGQPGRSLQPKTRGHYVWATAGIVLAFLAGAGVWWSLRQRTAASAHPNQVTLAVLPFKNLSGEQDTDYLRIALADQVATILSYSSGIAVRPSASTQKYAIGNLDPQAAGRELKVANVVTGHFLREGDRLQVTLEAVDVESNQLLWTDTVKVASKDLTDLDNKISSRTQQGLIPRLSSTNVAASTGIRPQSTEAYDLYLHSLALSHESATESRQAIPLLERAVALDPSYAPAWQELARRYYINGHQGGGNADLDRAEAAGQRALALNPNLSDSARILAVARVERGDLESAYDAAQDFLHRRPNDAQAHASMGYVLKYAGLVDKSVREYETAVTIDPSNYILRSGALAIMQTGDYKRAHEFAQIDAGSDWAEGAHAKIFLQEGKYKEAADAFRRGSDIAGRTVLAYLDHRPLSEIEAEAAKSETIVMTYPDPENKYWVAADFSFCGLKERAMNMLRLAVEGNYLGYPDRDPLFATIRGTPEYAAIRALAIQKQKQFLAHRAERDLNSHKR